MITRDGVTTTVEVVNGFFFLDSHGLGALTIVLFGADGARLGSVTLKPNGRPGVPV